MLTMTLHGWWESVGQGKRLWTSSSLLAQLPYTMSLQTLRCLLAQWFSDVLTTPSRRVNWATIFADPGRDSNSGERIPRNTVVRVMNPVFGKERANASNVSHEAWFMPWNYKVQSNMQHHAQTHTRSHGLTWHPALHFLNEVSSNDAVLQVCFDNRILIRFIFTKSTDVQCVNDESCGQ